MQRWFFDNFSSDASGAETHADHAQVNDAAGGDGGTSTGIGANQPNSDGRWHTFRVLVNQHMEPIERVAVTGECSLLGRWLPAKCVQLNRENGKQLHLSLMSSHLPCFGVSECGRW